MDKFPLLLRGAPAGELTTESEALYTWFTAHCRLPGDGLWCAWAVGDKGELRLGVLEPAGDGAVIRRRFSQRMTAPLGRLLRGEARPVGGEEPLWEPLSEPERFFRTPWLRQQLRGAKGILFRREGEKRFLAFPYDKEKSFPLAAWFCFATVRRIKDGTYAVFALDEREWPVFP